MSSVLKDHPTLEDYRKTIKRIVCSCGYVGLDTLPFHFYPHDGGWPVATRKEKLWLYVVCPRCKYQWVLWKLQNTPGLRVKE